MVNGEARDATSGEGAPPPGTGGDADRTCPDHAFLEGRRRLLARSGVALDGDEVPIGSMGVALTGGGVRSATIALGVVQALSRHRRLFDFDYLATVSGGGYMGSFVRSLFVPRSARGRTDPNAPVQDDDDPVRMRKFVEDVFDRDAKCELIDDPFAGGGAKLRNPIWWLREHGRYLAPNGPTDYLFALSYLARNWFAMLYTFTVAAAAALFVALWLERGLFALSPELVGYLRAPLGSETGGIDIRATPGMLSVTVEAGRAARGVLLSPFTVLPILFLLLSLAAGIAYWLTVSLRLGNAWSPPEDSARQRSAVAQFGWHAALIAVATVAIAATAAWFVAGDPRAIGAMLRFWEAPWPWWPVALGVLLAVGGVLVGVVVAVLTAVRSAGDAFTGEVRRRLTATSAWANGMAAATLGIALLDTIALAIVGQGRSWLEAHSWSGLVSAALVPAAAWLIGRVPQWLGGGRLAKLVGAHAWTVALIVGTLLFAAVALAADVAVHAVAWRDQPWADPIGEAFQWQRFLALTIVVFGLFAITGSFTGFINLSSLHSLYNGRLTRAFLGASNLDRLRAAAAPDGPPVTENHSKDYIDVSTYQAAPSIAPIHLIQTTLNETASHNRTQLIDRDRKGVPAVFDHAGVSIDAARAGTIGQKAFFSWAELKAAKVESLGVGQLAAISGAAASSAMGARTTLGGALAFTFANIRLGYWWTVNQLLPEAQFDRRPKWWPYYLWATRPARTFYYLWNEMTARYTRVNQRVYLTDGGHFENTAVYELLRRRVRAILVSDGGADPNYIFEDLENLVRKARIDLGLAITAADQAGVEALFGQEGARFFLNGDDVRDWREVARTSKGPEVALLLNVYENVHPNGGRRDPPAHRLVGRILWLKPRLFGGLPHDVVAYGLAHPPFPQQTTGDQFFDEAQWESYRALGAAMGELILRFTPRGPDAVRALLAGQGTAPQIEEGASIVPGAPEAEGEGRDDASGGLFLCLRRALHSLRLLPRRGAAQV